MSNKIESKAILQKTIETTEDATSVCIHLEHMAMAIVKRGIRAERIDCDTLTFSNEVASITPTVFNLLFCALSINLVGRNLSNDWESDTICFSFQPESVHGKLLLSRDGSFFRLHARTLESLRWGICRLSSDSDSLLAEYMALNRTLGNL